MTTQRNRDHSVTQPIHQENQSKPVKPVYFGVPGIPFPVYEIVEETTKNGEIVNKYDLRVYEEDSNPLVIHSEKAPVEVFGLLFRYMPTPSMLEIFVDGLRLRNPESRRRCEFIKGDPGAGKSFMAQLHAWMRTSRSPIVVDCGGKNLAELLYETVLDFESSKVPIEELEKRAGNGTLHPHSMNSLRNALSVVGADEKCFANTNNGRGIIILWDKVRKDEKSAETLRKILAQIMKDEGIIASTNALGLKTRPGPLYTAFVEDRPIIFDEYNKSKEGSDDCMQQVVQFLAGEIDEITVTNELKNSNEEGGISYTLNRKDMGPNFFVTATGNAVEDGVTTRALSKSANSRWQPVVLSKPTIEDWQHRWCQLLTGVPLSTLYHASKAQWDDKPSDFAKFLKQRRIDGLTPEEIKTIPEHQLVLIKHWRSVLSFTEKLAQYCHKLGTLLDPDTNHFEGLNFGEVLDEINSEEEFKNEVGFDFRTAIKLVEESLHNIPKTKPIKQSKGFLVSSFEAQPSLTTKEPEPLVLNLGTRLINAFKKELRRISVQRGKHKTYQQFRLWGEQFGVFAPSKDEESKPLLESHLNISPLDGNDLDSRVEIIQEQICLYFKAKYEELKDVDNDNILPLSQIKSFMAQLGTGDAKDNESTSLTTTKADIIKSQTKKRYRLAINENGEREFLEIEQPDKKGKEAANDDSAKQGNVDVSSSIFLVSEDKKSLIRAPFMRATLSASEDSSKLVDHEIFLLSLVLPVVGQKNINDTWVKNISKIEGVFSSDFDKSLKIAETQEMPISTMTVVLNANGEEKALHLFRNNKTGKMVVVGDSVSPHIQRLMTYARFEYVDKTQKEAKKAVASALYNLAPDHEKLMENEVKLAFLLRNKVKNNIHEDLQKPLSEIVAAKSLQTYNRVYVQRSSSVSRKPELR